MTDLELCTPLKPITTWLNLHQCVTNLRQREVKEILCCLLGVPATSH